MPEQFFGFGVPADVLSLRIFILIRFVLDTESPVRCHVFALDIFSILVSHFEPLAVLVEMNLACDRVGFTLHRVVDFDLDTVASRVGGDNLLDPLVYYARNIVFHSFQLLFLK